MIRLSTIYIYNEHQDFTFEPEQVAAYDPELDLKWSTDGAMAFHTGHPAIADGKIVLGAGDYIAAYVIDDGTESWTNTRPYSNNPVAIHNERVYSLCGGSIKVHSLADGEQIAENDDTLISPRSRASPMVSSTAGPKTECLPST